MNFLIEYQYVILYFSGAFFSFFAMISYIKFGNVYFGGKKKMGTPEDFFGDFDNDDLEALLDESFDVEELKSANEDSDGKTSEGFSFLGQNLEIENSDSKAFSESKNKNFVPKNGERS